MKSSKRILIICEGPTERDFCDDVLAPYLQQKGIQIQAPLIKKSAGGIVPLEVLKNQIERHLKQEQETIVTQLIDYYGIKDRHKFPKWTERKHIHNLIERVENLEGAMKNGIHESLRNRYIPYIQLHEFEALLFSDVDAFTQLFSNNELQGYDTFEMIFQNYDNPEMINDNEETCPSARLKKHIFGYNKLSHGPLIAEQTGIVHIRKKCIHFDYWVNKLEKLK